MKKLHYNELFLLGKSVVMIIHDGDTEIICDSIMFRYDIDESDEDMTEISGHRIDTDFQEYNFHKNIYATLEQEEYDNCITLIILL